MRVYISGKIGEEVVSEATRQKFARAEAMLRAKGYEVFNPCNENYQRHLAFNIGHIEKECLSLNIPFNRYAEILMQDLYWMKQCDAIYMLADWGQSNGANVELDFATATGKQRFWQQEEDAKLFCDDAGNYTDVWIPLE